MEVSLKKSPYLLYSRGLKHLKDLQLIQNDLKEISSKKGYKVKYLNYSYIVLIVAQWQTFIEEEVIFGFNERVRLTPSGAFGNILKLRLRLKDSIKKFNTPGKTNIDKLFNKNLGLKNLSKFLSWENVPNKTALELLDKIINTRHEIVHDWQDGIGKAEMKRKKESFRKDLNYDLNFECMKHLLNLAYLIDYRLKEHLFNLSGNEFIEQIEIPYPDYKYII